MPLQLSSLWVWVRSTTVDTIVQVVSWCAQDQARGTTTKREYTVSVDIGFVLALVILNVAVHGLNRGV